jgi:hypothetical protein
MIVKVVADLPMTPTGKIAKANWPRVESGHDRRATGGI